MAEAWGSNFYFKIKDSRYLEVIAQSKLGRLQIAEDSAESYRTLSLGVRQERILIVCS